MSTQRRTPPLPSEFVEFIKGQSGDIDHQHKWGDREIEPDGPVSDARDRFEAKHNRWRSARPVDIIHGVYCDCGSDVPAYDDLGDLGPRGVGDKRGY